MFLFLLVMKKIHGELSCLLVPVFFVMILVFPFRS